MLYWGRGTNYMTLSHVHSIIVPLVLAFLSRSQNHNEDGEEGVKAKIAKLSEDMQEQFRKLEE